MIKSICIVRLSALGDVLMLVPLVRVLQKQLPHTKLTWVISPLAYDMVEGMEGIEFIVLDKPQGVRDYWQFKKRLNDRTFDVLFACQASLRANLLYPFIRASRKIGYDRLRAKDGHGWFIDETITPGRDHTLESFLKFAQALDLKTESVQWDLPISQADYAWADAHLPKGAIFLVNPAASRPERSWLAEHYIKVIKTVQSRWPVHVVLTGGPSAYDKTLARAIQNEIACLDLVGKTQPKQLLAVISRAKLLLCPDTGPSHMAAAVGTPVIALHAVTSSGVSGPYPFMDLVVDCYPEAVVSVLKKDEKTNVWGTHAHGEETMKLVTVDAVMAKIESVFTEEYLSCK